MGFEFMFIWTVIVSAFMVFSYRNKIRQDSEITKMDWSPYKMKLSQSWWSGFLWASVALTLFYFLSITSI
jgi:hypothetical protein